MRAGHDFQPAGDAAIGRAEREGDGQRQREMDRQRQAGEAEAGNQPRHAADEDLPLDANIEEARLSANDEAEPGDDQRRCRDQRL